ncbi:radical SAM family heme chaperone HemW [Campylobacter sp. LR286c]|uniref:radical SAM family heme chaperone HemW n=1 Tax=Campylobacter sp. LR286c TaxID=2593545 RepID=UPI001238311D|nr:radical SAM family heme chaperone HemW [Campylobacter sp. LR286c]KAA6226369.1 coproporphyrinogen III oxidase family protein [Campylobacter sp. LR286c]
MHLYIHIPFCEQKCFYCSFTSLKKNGLEKPYFNALLDDLKFQFTYFNIKKNSIKTLFIGGGTPSVVPSVYYEKLFKFLENFLLSKAEISIEANVNSASYNWLYQMKNFNINRISFGAQSFNREKLKFLGRNHLKNEIIKALENAYKIDFKNINLDLIYDTKLDNKKMLEYELKNLENFKHILTHISAYHLSIEKNTRFYKKDYFKKNTSNLMRFFISSIENLGFKQYEVSNFGKICKHNLSYWQGKNYLACGLSGVSFMNNARFYTKSNLKDYIKNPSFRDIEVLNKKDLNLEHLFLGLRSIVGIDKKRLNQTQLEKALFLTKKKKLEFKNNKFYNTNYLLSDELVLFLSD